MKEYSYSRIKEKIERKIEEISSYLKEKLKRISSKRILISYDSYIGIFLLLDLFVLLITGFVLSLYYEPSPDGVEASLKFIMNQTPYGWLIRSIHYWGAHLFLGAVILQFLAKGLRLSNYKNFSVWITGCFLMVLSFFWIITGEFLTWSHSFLTQMETLTEELNGFPIFGKYLRLFIRGGDTVGRPTLTRFYSFHILYIFVFFTCIAILYLKKIYNLKIEENVEDKISQKFTPLSIIFIDSAICLFLLFALLLTLSVFVPREIPEIFDPAREVSKLKVEWYLQSLYLTYTLFPERIFFINRMTLFSFISFIALGAIFFAPLSGYVKNRTLKISWKLLFYLLLFYYFGTTVVELFL